MAIIDIKKRFPFLDKIEVNGKIINGRMTKTVAFNEKELILLKYLAYIDESLSTYVKQLLEKDLFENLNEDGTMKSSVQSTKQDSLELLKMMKAVMSGKSDNDEDEIAELKKCKERLELVIESLKEENTAFKTELDKQNEANEDLQEKNKQLSEECISLANENSDLEKEIVRLKKLLAKQEKDLKKVIKEEEKNSEEVVKEVVSDEIEEVSESNIKKNTASSFLKSRDSKK